MTALVVSGSAIAAGVWFQRQRSSRPCALVRHEVQAVPLGDGSRFVHVALHVRNAGKVELRLAPSEITSLVLQIAPASPGDIGRLATQRVYSDAERTWDFPVLGSYSPDHPFTLEPGEEEPIVFGVFAGPEVSHVLVRSWSQNPDRAKALEAHGWRMDTVHSLEGKP